MTKTQKKKFLRTSQTRENMVFRAFAVQPQTLDIKTRTVVATVATEAPVNIYDRENGVIPEVLRMDGCQLPADLTTPLLNSHRQTGVENVLGSARNYRIEGKTLAADLVFASDALGESVMRKVQEGHLRDISIGYEVFDAQVVQEGQRKNIGGIEYSGRCKVSTRWAPFESSITPIGADPDAKIREKQTENHSREAEIKQEARTMPEQIVVSTPPAPPVADPNVAKAAEEANRQAAIKEGQQREKIRQTEIRAMCSAIPGCEELAEKMITDGTEGEAIHRAITAHLVATKPPVGVAPNVEGGLTAREKFNAAAVDGLLLRQGLHTGKIADGAESLRGMSLLRLAEETILRNGGKITSHSSSEIASRALTTSDFPYLLANVLNKALHVYAQQTTDQTWRSWCKIGTLNDFKAGSRVSLSGVPTVEKVLENGEYKYVLFGEGKEAIQCATYGGKVPMTREMLINDDLNGLMELPQMLTSSALRAISDAVYAYLTSNTQLGSDSTALFDVSTHKNYVTAGTTLGVIPWNVLRGKIRIQKDKKNVPLNMGPKFLLVPGALEGLGEMLTMSPSVILSNANSGVVNPMQRNGTQLVVEGRLDASSTTAYYAIVDPAICPTVEVAFLNGVQTPTLISMAGNSPDVHNYFVRLDFGTCLRDYRGIAKDVGA